MLERGTLAIVTTHYSELKAFAFATEGVENASAEFDLNTLRPTYRLITGVPGRSNALAIAQRLGLPKEIADAAREYLDPSTEHVDDLLAQIQQHQGESETLFASARAERAEANRIRLEAEQRLRDAEQIRAEARQEAIAELEVEMREARDLIRRTRRAAEHRSQATDDHVELPQPAEFKEVEQTLRHVSRRRRPVQAAPEPIRIGDWVNIPTVGISGEVVGFSDDGESVEVASGSFRLTQPLTAVRREPRVEPNNARNAPPRFRLDQASTLN